MLDSIIGAINDALYSYILIILLIAGGIYFTVRTRFAQVRLLGAQFKALSEKPKDGKGVSSFQALMVSTASRVGTGNIIGVSTALCIGGFGSVFWMWLIALIGGATALIESTLAQIYKKRGESGSYGGPAYYIEAALGSRPLAVAFLVILVLTYALGFNMLASYNLQSTFSSYSFYNATYTPWIIGAVLALLVGYCILGGGKRIMKVTGFLVPIMGALYILVALVAVVLNITALPAIFATIFREAFDVKAIFGGFSGSCVMYGVKRGLFSNEAGVGSAPNAAAAADVSHPVKQGLVQMFSVFLDTLIICSATAFLCMSSGVEPSKALDGAKYVQDALAAVFGGFGPIFITVAMVLFAFTTLLGNLYYVDHAMVYILKKEPSKLFKNVFHVICALIVFLGAGLSASLLWNISDVLMGALTIINIPVIFILGKYAFRAIKNFEEQRKKGLDPVFYAEDIGLPQKTDYWNK